MTIEESFNRLQEEHHQLQDDYAHLSMMFENMGKEEEDTKALKLYDQALESSRMKTDFIQQISHEIRTSNILSGFTRCSPRVWNSMRPHNKEVTKGIVCTERITSLVNKMLELAEAGSDNPLERNDQVLAIQIAAQATEDSGISQATHLYFDLDLTPEAETVMLTTALAPATRVTSVAAR